MVPPEMSHLDPNLSIYNVVVQQPPTDDFSRKPPQKPSKRPRRYPCNYLSCQRSFDSQWALLVPFQAVIKGLRIRAD